MINGDIKFLFSDHPLMMVAQDNNILCRTQDSNTHDRTKKKQNYGRSIICSGCHKHIQQVQNYYRYKNISICDKYQ